MNMDIFQLLFNYLEERPYNNIHQNIKQDVDYLDATIQENKLHEQYKQLDLSDEQRKISGISWILIVLEIPLILCFIQLN